MPLGNGDVTKFPVLFSQFLLFLAPLHTVKWMIQYFKV
jgi:hypothetical protein